MAREEILLTTIQLEIYFHLIPANDDSIASISIILETLSKSIH